MAIVEVPEKRLPDKLVLFDGVCNLCNGLVQFIIKHDPAAKFTFASLQSSAGQMLLELYKLPLKDLDTVVYLDHGKIYLRSDAGLHICNDLGGMWKLFYIFILIPRSVRNFLYDLAANSRYRLFGRMDACMTPTEELKSRFL